MKNFEIRNDIVKNILGELKKSKTMEKLCKEYGENVDYLDHIPICFADLDVSARTEHGIIYINKKFINTLNEIPPYCAHEMTHHFQQCFADGPTKGSADDDYLDNENEIDGFQNQTEYNSEHDGKDKAEKYIDRVLDHHDFPDQKRNKNIK